jgi:hypothetical protein
VAQTIVEPIIAVAAVIVPPDTIVDGEHNAVEAHIYVAWAHTAHIPFVTCKLTPVIAPAATTVPEEQSIGEATDAVPHNVGTLMTAPAQIQLAHTQEPFMIPAAHMAPALHKPIVAQTPRLPATSVTIFAAVPTPLQQTASTTRLIQFPAIAQPIRPTATAAATDVESIRIDELHPAALPVLVIYIPIFSPVHALQTHTKPVPLIDVPVYVVPVTAPVNVPATPPTVPVEHTLPVATQVV